jgi:hypothetical protein
MYYNTEQNGKELFKTGYPPVKMENNMKSIGTIVLLPAILPFLNPVMADSTVFSRYGLEIKFNDQKRTLDITDHQLGKILEQGVIKAKVNGKEVSSDDKSLKYKVTVKHERAALIVEFPDNFVLTVILHYANFIEVHIDGKLDGPAHLVFRAAASEKAIAGILKDQAHTDRGVLITTLGDAETPQARSLFDPLSDLAITDNAAGKIQWKKHNGWQLHTRAAAGELLLSLSLTRNYYRHGLGIEYYTPIKKRTRWPTAPIVAMTWYGLPGWKGRPSQTLKNLSPHIDWISEHLLPYAGTIVFQLDDNYPHDDKRMRKISDYIRSKRLVPGIWFAPYVLIPAWRVDENPKWFIHDAQGNRIPSFGGISFRHPKLGWYAPTMNVNNPEVQSHWLDWWWKRYSNKWNFDFFKLDGLNHVVTAYRKAVDGDKNKGFRKGLEIARSYVGEEKFINGSAGIPLEAIGLIDGSRLGGDTGNDPHAIDNIIRWNFLNNVVWWCDPDAAANLYQAKVERARLNAQARALTGQQFLTDDKWTQVPPEIAKVWQRSFPSLNIKPANLYMIENYQKYNLFDLKIAKAGRKWDVVGLFNYQDKHVTSNLDLGRLQLQSEQVHVFEYWNSQYVGRFANNAHIPVKIAPYEGKVYSIVDAAKDRPVLISTSRHLSQGGVDLEKIEWQHKDNKWIVRGKSSHLVTSDTYELVFARANYRMAKAISPANEFKIIRQEKIVRARVVPKQSGSMDWTVTFEPPNKP